VTHLRPAVDIPIRVSGRAAPVLGQLTRVNLFLQLLLPIGCKTSHRSTGQQTTTLPHSV